MVPCANRLVLSLGLVMLPGLATELASPCTTQEYTSKYCSACGQTVPVTSRVGGTCPHCNAKWVGESMNRLGDAVRYPPVDHKATWNLQLKGKDPQNFVATNLRKPGRRPDRDGWSQESPERSFIWFTQFISGPAPKEFPRDRKDGGVVYGVGIDQIFLLEALEEPAEGKWYRLKYDTPQGVVEATVRPFPQSGSPPAYEATLEAERTVFGTTGTTKFEIDQIARLHRAKSEPKKVKLLKPLFGVLRLKDEPMLQFATIYLQGAGSETAGPTFPFKQNIRFEGPVNIDVPLSKLAEIVIRDVKGIRANDGEVYTVYASGTARSRDGESLAFTKLPDCSANKGPSYFGFHGILKDGRAFEAHVSGIDRITFGEPPRK